MSYDLLCFKRGNRYVKLRCAKTNLYTWEDVRVDQTVRYFPLILTTTSISFSISGLVIWASAPTLKP